IDPFHIILCLFLQLVRQVFKKKSPTQRIHCIRHSRFVCNNLLCSQCNFCCFLRRQGNRFVVTVGVERLGTTKNSCQSLISDTDDIILCLLCGEGRATGLSVEPKRLCLWIACPQVFCNLCPQPSCSSKFGNFLEKIIMAIKEKRYARCKLVYVQTLFNRCLKVSLAISQCKC